MLAEFGSALVEPSWSISRRWRIISIFILNFFFALAEVDHSDSEVMKSAESAGRVQEGAHVAVTSDLSRSNVFMYKVVNLIKYSIFWIIIIIFISNRTIFLWETPGWLERWPTADRAVAGRSVICCCFIFFCLCTPSRLPQRDGLDAPYLSWPPVRGELVSPLTEGQCLTERTRWES